MNKKFTIALFAWLLSLPVIAQQFISSTKPSLIGFHFSLVDYNSPNRIDSTSLKDVFDQADIFKPSKQSSAFTISYWKGLSKNLDFSGKLNGIFYDYALNSRGEQKNNEFGTELEAAINLRPYGDNHLFAPFLTAGVGGGYYTDKFGGYIPLGIGFQFNIQSQVYFFLQSQYRLTLSKDIFPDNLFHSLGVAVNISKPKPDVPPPPVIVDRDNDGVLDSLDACPDEAGLAALQGCPDKDADGIADKDDKCPDVAGLEKYEGCPIPDTDGDGVNDEVDKCPNEAGLAKYDGCPIPDSDKDGVNDEEDKCPNEAGPASNYGCPVIDVVIVERINKAAKNVFFATGSAKLLKKSFASLNDVVEVMKENPSYNIDIEGHTDNTGSDTLNQRLSNDRAASVRQYLVDNEIEESRISSVGYGEERPVADNSTVAGRAQNRRVEMKLRNY